MTVSIGAGRRVAAFIFVLVGWSHGRSSSAGGSAAAAGSGAPGAARGSSTTIARRLVSGAARGLLRARGKHDARRRKEQCRPHRALELRASCPVWARITRGRLLRESAVRKRLPECGVTQRGFFRFESAPGITRRENATTQVAPLARATTRAAFLGFHVVFLVFMTVLSLSSSHCGLPM